MCVQPTKKPYEMPEQEAMSAREAESKGTALIFSSGSRTGTQGRIDKTPTVCECTARSSKYLPFIYKR